MSNIWTLYTPYTNPSTLSTTVPVQLQILNWQVSGTLSLNSSVYSFLNVRSVKYFYTYTGSYTAASGTTAASTTLVVPQFRAEMIFQLLAPLNALDPTQIITAIFNTGYSSATASTAYYVGSSNYWVEVILSQGGQMLNSANYFIGATSPVATYPLTSATNVTWYIPISNFFTLSTPGVWYKLTINGTYQDNT
jgi:hypothetical protein